MKIKFGKTEIGIISIITGILGFPAGLLLGFGILDGNVLYFLISLELFAIIGVIICINYLLQEQKNRKGNNTHK